MFSILIVGVMTKGNQNVKNGEEKKKSRPGWREDNTIGMAVMQMMEHILFCTKRIRTNEWDL